MKNVKLCFAKKFFSITTALSMICGYGYVSAMKPESNSYDLGLQEESRKLSEVCMRYGSLLVRNDMFTKLVQEAFRECFQQIHVTLQIIEHRAIASDEHTYKLVIENLAPASDEHTYKLAHEALEKASLVNKIALKFWEEYALFVPIMKECCETNLELQKINSDKDIPSPSNLVRIATMRYTDYFLAYRGLVNNLLIFISSVEEVAKLASTENLSSDVKRHISGLQRIINEKAYLLNTIKELCIKELYR